MAWINGTWVDYDAQGRAVGSPAQSGLTGDTGIGGAPQGTASWFDPAKTMQHKQMVAQWDSQPYNYVRRSPTNSEMGARALGSRLQKGAEWMKNNQGGWTGADMFLANGQPAAFTGRFNNNGDPNNGFGGWDPNSPAGKNWAAQQANPAAAQAISGVQGTGVGQGGAGQNWMDQWNALQASGNATNEQLNSIQANANQPQVMPGIGGYAPPEADPNDPFSGFRVEPMDPRFSQTTAAQVTPGGIAEMMNPYLQSVRDQTMNDIERQRQLAQMTTDDQANAAKAFGGNRHGVANALTNDAFARQSAQQYANLNAQGFNAASGLAMQNAGLAQQAGLSNAANYMAGRGQDINQNQAFMGNALAQRGQDINQNQFNANLGLAQRGQDIGWNLGHMGQQLNAYNVAGNLMNSAGNMDWNSLNQANNATSQPGSSSTTTPGADPWNTLIGGLITGWGLTRP